MLQSRTKHPPVTHVTPRSDCHLRCDCGFGAEQREGPRGERETWQLNLLFKRSPYLRLITKSCHVGWDAMRNCLTLINFVTSCQAGSRWGWVGGWRWGVGGGGGRCVQSSYLHLNTNQASCTTYIYGLLDCHPSLLMDTLSPVALWENNYIFCVIITSLKVSLLNTDNASAYSFPGSPFPSPLSLPVSSLVCCLSRH